MGMGAPTDAELGEMCKWEDEDSSHWDTSIVPCGSEGSLEYTKVKTGGENSLASLVVVFTGDLRDYDNVDEIKNYFNDLVKDKMIRSGILEIDVEWNDTLILRYDDKSKSFVEVVTIPQTAEI
jgi:hypothetical protein